MGLTGHALTMAGTGGAFVAFITAASVLALLVFSFALVVARAQEATVDAIRARAGQVKRYGGYVLIAVGLWSVALALFAEFFSHYFPV